MAAAAARGPGGPRGRPTTIDAAAAVGRLGLGGLRYHITGHVEDATSTLSNKRGNTMVVIMLRCKARKGAILRAAVGLDSAQVGLVPMGSVVEVVASEMLGAKERVSVVGAVDGTTGWGSRAMFESCPAAAEGSASRTSSKALLRCACKSECLRVCVCECGCA